MRYLAVKNYERFQHYKDRRPPWIKYHVSLLDDYELCHMSYGAQLVYDRLLLIAARTDNNIPNDPEHISRDVRIDTETVTDALQNLLDAGFLVVSERKRAASKAIARRKQNAEPETETETETEADTETEKNAADLGAERQVRDVYDHWRQKRGKRDKRYDKISPNRRQKIKARLAEFSADELKQAIDNVALDTWAERAKHDDITTLFGNREKVDRWLEMTGKGAADEQFGYARYS